MTTPTRWRLSGGLVVLLAVGTVAACSGADDHGSGVPAEMPNSVTEIVAATLAGAGLEVGYRVIPREGEPYALLRAVSVYDTLTKHAYQTAFGRVTGDFESGQIPPEIDLGENWVIDGEGYQREPGSEAATNTSTRLAYLLAVDSVSSDAENATAVLEAMLTGWPGAAEPTTETIGGVQLTRTRLEREDGDRLDVWVDAGARLARVEYRTDRSPTLLVEMTYEVLDRSPDIPPLPANEV